MSSFVIKRKARIIKVRDEDEASPAPAGETGDDVPEGVCEARLATTAADARQRLTSQYRTARAHLQRCAQAIQTLWLAQEHKRQR
jgi:hypothetical protein